MSSKIIVLLRTLACAMAASVLAHAKPALADPGPVRTSAIYTGDWLRNTTGGIATGAAYLQDIDLSIDISLERWLGAGGGHFYADLLWNDDTGFSGRYPGDAQSVSNIDTDRAFRLYEMWYEHAFSQALGLRIGLYDLNTEFDSIATAGLFLNGSHGMGYDYGQTGRSGPSVFPRTSFAARLQWQVDEHHLLRYAVLDAVPGDPNDPTATSVEFNSGEGFLHSLEYNFDTGSGLRFGLGGFLYSEDFERIDQTGMPVNGDGNGGLYAFTDIQVFDDSASGRSMNTFVRYGRANSEFNRFESYLGLGAVLYGVFARRPDDQLGLAIASVRSGDEYRRVSGAEARETSIELTYSARINDWLRVQPDVQYIVNPGVDRGLNDALVVGVRVEISYATGAD